MAHDRHFMLLKRWQYRQRQKAACEPRERFGRSTGATCGAAAHRRVPPEEPPGRRTSPLFKTATISEQMHVDGPRQVPRRPFGFEFLHSPNRYVRIEGMRFGTLFLALCVALGLSRADDKTAYTFGTTVVDSSGLQGRVYYLKPGTRKLPNFGRMRAIGSVYTTSLNVWPQKFDEGFPSITGRFEWFAIEYTGRLWIENDGHYRFSLLADDGARLYLNHRVVIDNDGSHNSTAISGGATLTRGVHEIKVEYFQGPRFTVALVLAVSPPGEPWHIFNMNEFKPPNDPEKLETGEISDIEIPTQ